VPNRESVLERYRRDFEGMVPVVGSGRPGAADSAGGADGALLLLERLKRELDPDGVFPDVTELLPGEVR
jgi:FAD/FMN-containing dehydrogenase